MDRTIPPRLAADHPTKGNATPKDSVANPDAPCEESPGEASGRA